MLPRLTNCVKATKRYGALSCAQHNLLSTPTHVSLLVCTRGKADFSPQQTGAKSHAFETIYRAHGLHILGAMREIVWYLVCLAQKLHAFSSLCKIWNILRTICGVRRHPIAFLSNIVLVIHMQFVHTHTHTHTHRHTDLGLQYHHIKLRKAQETILYMVVRNYLWLHL